MVLYCAFCVDGIVKNGSAFCSDECEEMANKAMSEMDAANMGKMADEAFESTDPVSLGRAADEAYDGVE